MFGRKKEKYECCSYASNIKEVKSTRKSAIRIIKESYLQDKIVFIPYTDGSTIIKYKENIVYNITPHQYVTNQVCIKCGAIFNRHKELITNIIYGMDRVEYQQKMDDLAELIWKKGGL